MWATRRAQVMISSTVHDLGIERAAAARAIEEFRFERFQSETIGAQALTPSELCEEAALECDLMILILGCRYGWVIPELGISVTHREWQVAKEADPRKILVYVKADPTQERELRQTDLINLVTDFSAGHFRYVFDRPEELPFYANAER